MERPTAMECTLCRPSLGPIIAEGKHWRLVLNHNQDLLGKCFLVARRHVEEVWNLQAEEWLGLHRHMADAVHMLTSASHPDHFNFAFLQNQDRHVHLHIIPRYAGEREFEGIVFHDPGHPGHYEIDVPPYRLDHDREAKLAKLLGALVTQG
jgi:diadenosine tetraphosphate (Ap4A) HIT family hydrolase